MKIFSHINKYRPSPSILLIWWIAFLLYAMTTAPSIVELFDDSLEFQLVGPTLGIAHPTGYPLYTLMAGLWSRVLFPVGNWAWRMNLLSAIFAATTISTLWVLTSRYLFPSASQRNVEPALAATLAFTLSPVWWSQATVAEIYTLHGLFVAGILYGGLGIGDWGLGSKQTQGNTEGTGLNKSNDNATPPLTLSPPHLVTPASYHPLSLSLTPLFLLIGLALTHHRTTFLLLPGLALYLLWAVPGIWRPRWVWFKWGLALVGPLLFYAYIPIRAAMGAVDLHGSYRNTWQGFWRHVWATDYTGFFQDNPLAVERGLSDWLGLFQLQFGTLGLFLGAIGLFWVWRSERQQRKGWVFILLVLLTNLVFALNYKVADVENFLLPAFLCLSLLIGGGVASISWGLSKIASPHNRIIQLTQLLLIALILSGPFLRGTVVNRSQAWFAHDFAVEMAKVAFPPQSQVIALEGEATALKYMQQAEGLGYNAIAVFANHEDERRRLLEEVMSSGVPTYLTRQLPGIESQYSFSGEGPLIRVWPRGSMQTPSPSQPLELVMADNTLQIEGIDLDILEQAGGPTARLALYWRPLVPLAQRYKVSLRVQDAAHNTLLWPDGQPAVADCFPLRQVAYTDHWPPDELIRDVHYLALPPLHSQSEQLEFPLHLLFIIYDASSVQEVGRWQIPIEWSSHPPKWFTESASRQREGCFTS